MEKEKEEEEEEEEDWEGVGAAGAAGKAAALAEAKAKRAEGGHGAELTLLRIAQLAAEAAAGSARTALLTAHLCGASAPPPTAQLLVGFDAVTRFLRVTTTWLHGALQFPLPISMGELQAALLAAAHSVLDASVALGPPLAAACSRVSSEESDIVALQLPVIAALAATALSTAEQAAGAALVALLRSAQDALPPPQQELLPTIFRFIERGWDGGISCETVAARVLEELEAALLLCVGKSSSSLFSASAPSSPTLPALLPLLEPLCSVPWLSLLMRFAGRNGSPLRPAARRMLLRLLPQFLPQPGASFSNSLGQSVTPSQLVDGLLESLSRSLDAASELPGALAAEGGTFSAAAVPTEAPAEAEVAATAASATAEAQMEVAHCLALLRELLAARAPWRALVVASLDAAIEAGLSTPILPTGVCGEGPRWTSPALGVCVPFAAGTASASHLSSLGT